ncbi:transthyretin-like protein [Prunus dulcis]|uniref:2-oxo-4-hydroxy-4-carboxy-5-ureidoimidazoline decarboxylase n=1 Tax=Prunus dulcis TaxID=3755 RepID=A0A4Y1QZB5_PRUDU|nr:transthyretin-like protein [Prunus dulcis]
MGLQFEEDEFLACCGSTKFAKEMAKASPFSSLDEAVTAAREIWFNQVDVHAWLKRSLRILRSDTRLLLLTPPLLSGVRESRQLPLQLPLILACRQKFGFIFLICASGKSTDGILSELKKRYPNRPIAEFEIAAQEQMKITELRLAKLFSTKENVASTCNKNPTLAKKVEDRVSVIGAHLTAASDASSVKNLKLHLELVHPSQPMSWMFLKDLQVPGPQPRPMFGESDVGGWLCLGCSTTDNDGRIGQLMSIVDVVNPGIYRINFNTGKYARRVTEVGPFSCSSAAVTFLIHNVPWKLGLCVAQQK